MGKKSKKCRSYRMYLNLYDYQSKARRYKKGLTYLKNRVTTNQKHTTDSQKWKRKGHKHNTKDNHQITKGKKKRKRNEEEIQNQLENKV